MSLLTPKLQGDLMLQAPRPGTEAAERRAGWHHLTEIFSAPLRESFVEQAPLDFVSLHQTLDTWESFARAHDGKGPLGHPNTLDEWERMRAMLWCAEHVQKTTPLPGGAPPAALTELPAAAPREALSRADWSLACIRLFRGDTPGRRIAVPIALADEMVQLKGGIATLVLDVFSPGTGRLTLHPEESFRVVPDADFTESLDTAWRLALEVGRSDDRPGYSPDVVWRLLRESPSISGLDEKAFFESSGLRLTGEIKGRSASGAAARAFQHLLKGTHADPDVFVLAQVRKDGVATSQLQGVGGVRAKVEAIADTGKPSLVVVTQKDRAETELTVSKKQANARIEILEVDSTRFTALHGVRPAPTLENVPPAIKSLLEEGRKVAADDDRYAEAREAFEAALAHPDAANHALARVQAKSLIGSVLRTDDPDAARPLLRECLEALSTTPCEKLRENVLGQLGDLEGMAGNCLEAKALLTQAVDISRRLQDRLSTAENLAALAHVADGQGQCEEAIDLFDHAAEAFMAEYQRHDPATERQAMRGLGVCFNNKSLTKKHQLDLPGALISLSQAIEWFRKSKSDEDLASALFLLAEARFADAKWDEGIKSLDESLAIARKRNDYVWACRCLDLMGRLRFKHGDAKGAQRLFGEALALIREKGKPKELVDYLGRHARLYKECKLKEEAKKLLNEEKELSEKHELLENYADAVLDLAELEEGKHADVKRKEAVRAAIAGLEKFLLKVQVKGRQAFLMGRIGSLHQRLEHWDEALGWFTRAREVFTAIGDMAGVANCLGSLAEIARTKNDPVEELKAYRQILSVLQGKPVPHLVAGTKINMGVCLMNNGSFRDAKQLFDEAAETCRKHQLREFQESVVSNLERVKHFMDAFKPASLSFAQLVRELHEWVTFFPEAKDSILRFWCYCRDAELYANTRSLVGVKFLIIEDDTKEFLALAERLDAFSDLNLQAVTPEEPASGMDFVPFPKDKPIPKRVALTEAERVGGVRVISWRRGGIHWPYSLTSSEATSKTSGQTGVIIFGRATGLPPQAHEVMLGQTADDLISKKLLCLPYMRVDGESRLLREVRMAKEQLLMPTYSGSLPESGEVEDLAHIDLSFPVVSTKAGGHVLRKVAQVKRKLIRVLSLNQDEAVALLLEIQENLDDLRAISGATECIAMAAHLLRFSDRGSLECHVALVRVLGTSQRSWRAEAAGEQVNQR